MNEVAKKSASKKLIRQLVTGAIAGAAFTGGFLVLSDDYLDLKDLGTMAAVVAGLTYLMIGLMVGLGVASPGVGARYLNVEDDQELREQRSLLSKSVASMVLIGVLLLALAAAPSDRAPGLLSAPVAAALSIGSVLALIAVMLMSRNQGDELIKQLGIEASSLAFHILATALAVWSVLAHLDYVGWISPLGMLASVAYVYLLSIFAATGKRGLMTPR
jgi:cytochrome bd-type quinol oxidase subunit 2